MKKERCVSDIHRKEKVNVYIYCSLSINLYMHVEILEKKEKFLYKN